MSNEEWSDDEEDNIEPQPERLFPPSDSESEDDFSEINAMIVKKLENKTDVFSFSETNLKKEVNKHIKKEESKNTKKEGKNNKINWADFLKKDDSKKEKKWISKRMKDRKEKEGKVTVTRKFNPRLPIPNKNKIKKHEKIINTTNINDFPEL